MSRATGVGLGWRTELAADLLRDPSAVDFVEVVAESCYVQPSIRREACACAEVWPVVPHGVKLSLGCADGIHLDKARKLGRLARQLRAPVVSEHVAMTRGRDRDIGHLTQLPRTRHAVQVVARNVAALRRHLPDVPLLLENVAATLRWPDDELDEATFYREITEATGCDLLLDLGNLYANAVNEGHDPQALLRAFPLDRVAMVHIAGGVVEDGFYFDTHAAPVCEPVFGLLRTVMGERGAIPVLLERDGDFGDFAALRAELGRVRDAATSAGPARLPGARDPAPTTPRTAAEPSADRRLADAQRDLAVALTEPALPRAAVDAFGDVALVRTRGILERKRVDDALPLLPRTAALGVAAHEVAMHAVARCARAPRRGGLADARRIADAAVAHQALADAARHDRLLLRARFTSPDGEGVVHPRRGPFVGRERLDDGTTLWALKGPGRAAAIRLFQRRPHAHDRTLAPPPTRP